MIKSTFAEFGSGTMFMPPAEIRGNSQIAVGSNLFVGPGSLLFALPHESPRGILIRIGDRVSITGLCTISAVRSIHIEDSVLMARNVYLSDHSHRFTDVNTPIRDQGIDKISPVRVGRGAWLGQNVVICPGVTIGRGAVIAANSVVKCDIPDHCIAAGAPASIKRRFAT